ncbi:hypothetical protein ACO0LC_11930 [Undibacterium sp. JH2W]|uniref:hypothetical protein n=1 Tax=Undibacterium sp. JH2W TaxID=3413037 RepID=UPI003BF20052
MSKLLEYLNTLDKDADAREAHIKDPAGSMTNFGLTDKEQAAVHVGSKQAVADVLGLEVDDLPALDSLVGTY